MKEYIFKNITVSFNPPTADRWIDDTLKEVCEKVDGLCNRINEMVCSAPFEWGPMDFQLAQDMSYVKNCLYQFQFYIKMLNNIKDLRDKRKSQETTKKDK